MGHRCESQLNKDAGKKVMSENVFPSWELLQLCSFFDNLPSHASVMTREESSSPQRASKEKIRDTVIQNVTHDSPNFRDSSPEREC